MKTLKLSLVFFFFAVSAFALTTPSIDPTTYVFSAEPKAVLMTFADGPTTRGFAWQTDASVNETKLWVLEGSHDAADADLFESQGIVGVNTKCEDRSESPITVHCHQAQVYGLTPGKTYSYRLGGGGHYAYGSFDVRDVSGGEIVILNMNDAQVRSADKLYVWENTVARATALVGKPDLVLTGGDLFDVNWFYKQDLGSQTKTDANWFVHPGYGDLLFGNQNDQYRYNYWKWALDMDLALPYLRGVPWALGRGNHDCEGVVMKPASNYGDANGDIYYEHVTAVNWNEKCHSFDYGNVHVVVLPCLSRGDPATEKIQSLYGDVATWVAADLAAAQAAGKTDWTIVEMHWGPYTTGDHGLDAGKDGAIAPMFAPIFSQYHVDLVMQAHDHTYSKTLPYKWDAAGVYTQNMPDPAVVNSNPRTETIGGETYDLDPQGTYYVIPGCAGHRVGEDGTTYVGKTGGNSYTTRKYKVAVGKLTQASATYGTKVGDDASQNPNASMFGVLKIKGDTLAYDVYTVATDGNSAPALYDTLRVKKTLKKAPVNAFRVTPYVQRPATNAMSVLWLTETNGPARISWWPAAGGDVQSAEVMPEFASELGYTPLDQRSWTSTQKGPILSLPWQYRHRIEGLAPGTRYRYAVELAGGAAYTNSFKTTPGRDSPVRFICYSDCETEPESTGKYEPNWTDPVTEQNRNYYVDQTEGFASNIVRMIERKPDFISISGDLVQYGYEQRDWDEFWRHQAGVYNDPAGSIPILASPGNHDSINSESGETGVDGGMIGMRRWTRYFEVEKNGVTFAPGDGDYVADAEYAEIRQELFHRVDYGRVTLIYMDSNNGDDSDKDRDSCRKFYSQAYAPSGTAPAVAPDFNPGSKQYAWITNQLADAQAKGQFTFVFCHHMPYSVGYHNRYNGEQSEPYSAIALRALVPAFLKYGVTAWIAGHDEIMEHSRVFGKKTLAGGGEVDSELNIYDVGNSGDGLRGGGPRNGPWLSGHENPYEVFRAHVDAPEIYEDNVLVDGGKHYGHLEVNVAQNAKGKWECTLTPVYIFVSKDKNGKPQKFERRVFNDEITIDEDGQRITPVPPEPPEPPQPSDGWTRDEQGNCLIQGGDDLVHLQQWVADGSNTVGMTFLQTADIALTGVWTGIGAGNNKDKVGTEATYKAKAFQGTYDGGGHTVSGIVLNRDDYTGFFGSAYGATIRNLKLQVADNGNGGFATTGGAKPNDYCGALVVGVSVKTTIENVETLAGVFTAKKAAAGIVGYATGGTVLKGCVNRLAVKSENNEKAGGLIACAQNSGSYSPAEIVIESCADYGNVTAKAGTVHAGGLVSFADFKVIFKGENVVGKDVTISPAIVSVASLNDGSVELATGASFQVPAGYQTVDKKAVDGLRFATVANGVATLVREADLTANKAYKVMAPVESVAYQFNESGWISFDRSLYSSFNPNVTAKEGLTLEATQQGAVLTYRAESPADGFRVIVR